MFLRDRSFVEKVIYNFSVRFTRALRGRCEQTFLFPWYANITFASNLNKELKSTLEKFEPQLDKLNKLLNGGLIDPISPLSGDAEIEVQILKNQKRDVELQLDFMKKMQESIQ